MRRRVSIPEANVTYECMLFGDTNQGQMILNGEFRGGATTYGLRRFLLPYTLGGNKDDMQFDVNAAYEDGRSFRMLYPSLKKRGQTITPTQNNFLGVVLTAVLTQLPEDLKEMPSIPKPANRRNHPDVIGAYHKCTSCYRQRGAVLITPESLGVESVKWKYNVPLIEIPTPMGGQPGYKIKTDRK